MFGYRLGLLGTAFLLAVGCQEYNINSDPKVEPGDNDTDVDTGSLDVDTDPDTDTELATDDDPSTDPPVEGPVATEPVYAHTSDKLFSIDPLTGAKTLIGKFHNNSGNLDQFIDIAIDLNGNMYAGTFTDLYSVDASNAKVTFVCTPDAGMTALTFTDDGVLIAGGDDGIRKIDVGNCQTTSLVGTGTYLTSGDLVGLPDGYLYWTVDGDSGNDDLVRVNPNTGQATWIGTINGSNLYGLGYTNDKLYGFSSSGKILKIEPSNATSSVVLNATDPWWGATTNPVVW